MAFERLIKRTLWVAKCPTCGESVERPDNPPRERRCMTCDVWVAFKEESFTGPDFAAPR